MGNLPPYFYFEDSSYYDPFDCTLTMISEVFWLASTLRFEYVFVNEFKDASSWFSTFSITFLEVLSSYKEIIKCNIFHASWRRDCHF